MIRAAVSRAVQLLSPPCGPQPIRNIEPKYTKLFVNNEWTNSSAGRVIGTFNPATGRLITEVEEADWKDVHAAVVAANKAFARGSEWRRMDGSRRSQLLYTLADLVERDKNILASLETLDNGKPFAAAYAVDLPLSVDCLRYYAECAQEMGDAFTASGVCGEIIPWMAPLLTQAWKLAPALAMGNTVVLKLPERSPLSGLHLASLVQEAGFPEGVVNVIVGYDANAGRALVSHKGISKKATIEVLRMARKDANSLSGEIAPLYVDGRNLSIIFADSDLSEAIHHSHHGIYLTNDHCCSAGSRAFVEAKVYDEFVDRCQDLAERLILGDPFEPSTQQGPQIDGHQVKEILRHVERGKRDGAHLVTGGKKWGDRGHYVLPTVFANVADDMSVAQREIVGPVMKVIRFESMEDLLQKSAFVNDVHPAAVITKDADKAKHIASNTLSGSIWVNGQHEYHHNQWRSKLCYPGDQLKQHKQEEVTLIARRCKVFRRNRQKIHS